VKTAIILQARLDSSRLPGKALLPLGGEPVVVRVMEALNAVSADFRILACPEDSVRQFAGYADRCGFHLVPGSKEDVLSRFCKALSLFDADRVIRATGDNPFVFADAAAAIHTEACALDADYAGYDGLPYGAGVEAVGARALLRAGREAVTPFDREHVCPYLYNNAAKFSLHRPPPPAAWKLPALRLTIDTKEDYEAALALYEKLRNAPDPHNGKGIIEAARALWPVRGK
jgi:spore coat polysaccharide biosynthesis protein SpsF